MKKLLIAMTMMLILGGVAHAQYMDDAIHLSKEIYEIYGPKGDTPVEAYRKKLEAMEAKTDFKGLPDNIHFRAMNHFSRIHPAFTRMVFLGVVDQQEERKDEKKTQEKKTFYFVVSEADKDYFYMVHSKYSRFWQGYTFGKVLAVGETGYNEDLSRETLKDLQKSLLAPFNMHLEAVLTEAPLGAIQSVKVVSKRSAYSKKGSQYTNYALRYTLKDGTEFKRRFKHTHAKFSISGDKSKYIEEQVEKI